MSNAMLAGVSGMNAHQKMIDVAGNNLANMSTTGFKSSRVTFAELLSETIRQASQPTEALGGANPLQIGSGVKLANVDRNMAQGTLVTTGNPLDMAIEGPGYFVLYDGTGEVYTRVGAFGVDSEYYLVDPGTGYRVQRTGSAGEVDGFQDLANDSIRIPYDMALPARATTVMTFNGNLSADVVDPTANLLASGFAYTRDSARASDQTKLVELDQVTGSIAGGDLAITGRDAAGNPVDGLLSTSYGAMIDASTTLGDVITAVDALYAGSRAYLYNGEIRLCDDEAGYSQTDLNLELTGATGTLDLPEHFKLLEAGGNANRAVSMEIFDSQGTSHTLSASFVRTDEENMWDLVVAGVSGDVTLVDRRIGGITFQADGSYGGLDDTIDDVSSVRMTFSNDPATIHEIQVELGTVNEFDGISQFGGEFTVAPSTQDGYASGTLSSLSVTREGVLQGMFTNGIRRDIAGVKLAVFPRSSST